MYSLRSIMIDNEGRRDRKQLLKFHPVPAPFFGSFFLNGVFRGFLAPRRRCVRAKWGIKTRPFVAGKKVACLLRDPLEKGGWVSVFGSKLKATSSLFRAASPKFAARTLLDAERTRTAERSIHEPRPLLPSSLTNPRRRAC